MVQFASSLCLYWCVSWVAFSSTMPPSLFLPWVHLHAGRDSSPRERRETRPANYESLFDYRATWLLLMFIFKAMGTRDGTASPSPRRRLSRLSLYSSTIQLSCLGTGMHSGDVNEPNIYEVVSSETTTTKSLQVPELKMKKKWNQQKKLVHVTRKSIQMFNTSESRVV